jgi:hypothetical protein|tara:strand:- start:1211 stop:1963 length:753 start_codon:yes stop_codon:yes gene_type:complete
MLIRSEKQQNKDVNMRHNYTAILFVLITLSGCSSKQPSRIINDVTTINIPELNKISRAEIGDTLLEKSIAYTYEGLELFTTISDGGSSREYVMTPHKLPFIKIDNKGQKYYQASANNYYVNDITFGRRIPLYGEYLILKPDGSLDLTGYYDLSTADPVATPDPKFKVGKLVNISQPSFKQELIYNGKSKDTVKFMYREFSKDFARPSFSQEVNYDLTESNVIGFKGARIEILNATNTKIEYKALKSFPNK